METNIGTLKPLNCKFKNGHTRYMRCINKDDLSYVDVGIPMGTDSVLRNIILKYADIMSGSIEFGDKQKKYHYYFIHSVNENKEVQNQEHSEIFNKGQEIDNLDEYIIVNQETLEIIERHKFNKMD